MTSSKKSVIHKNNIENTFFMLARGKRECEMNMYDDRKNISSVKLLSFENYFGSCARKWNNNNFFLFNRTKHKDLPHGYNYHNPGQTLKIKQFYESRTKVCKCICR